MTINNFNYMLVNLTRQLRALVKSQTKDSPLTFEQIRAISHIARFEGISQVELANLLEAKAMAASTIVNALEKTSLVIRKRDKSDRRTYRLHLTAAGKKVADELQGLSKQIFKLMTKNISEAELHVFYSTMEKMQENIIHALKS
ncbi:MarR family winged helix-turn-helix transcriptional regulator [Legionella septentrionalis]|uniref:MarR family winged helix-turn-helix transcriptional regulator n=1 Tax=Legionella septentrionalis TaxID=2498109 RepID=UPI000F8E99F7|nr:MarR family transcriptional regulator [Legionella septentrionalis]RUR14880.1 MarR family transcriptional regulator [Legionella septentrionalis]